MRSNSIKTLENRIKPSKLVKTRSNSGKNPVKRDNTKPVEENPVKKKKQKKRKKKGRGNETEREKETGRKNERRKRRVMKRKKREKKSKKKGPVG